MNLRNTFLPAQVNQILRLTQNAFLILGVLALSYAGYVLVDAWLYQAAQVRQFEQALNKTIPISSEATDVVISESAGLGRIEISQIGLTAMIMEGTDEWTLQRAVGHIQGTPLPGQHGNVALAGHRDSFFRELRNIRQNHEITLTTLSGSYRYLVESTRVVEPEQIEVLDNAGDDILTLVTCYPFNFVGSAPKRFIVRARRIPA